MEDIGDMAEERSKEFTSGEQLLIAVAAHDLNAFELLYDEFSTVIYSVALNILKVPSDAEDVVQDVFVTIWNKAADFDPKHGSALTWVIVMTRRKAIDRYRSHSRKSQVLEEFKLDATQTKSEDGELARLTSDIQTKAGELKEALTKINPDQREAIELAFINGLSHSEIARHLSEPIGTIKARIRRGVDSLRSLLAFMQNS